MCARGDWRLVIALLAAPACALTLGFRRLCLSVAQGAGGLAAFVDSKLARFMSSLLQCMRVSDLDHPMLDPHPHAGPAALGYSAAADLDGRLLRDARLPRECHGSLPLLVSFHSGFDCSMHCGVGAPHCLGLRLHLGIELAWAAGFTPRPTCNAAVLCARACAWWRMLASFRRVPWLP